MSRRRVKCTCKNSDGDITCLGNKGELWSPRHKANAIRDIERGLHTYYVKWENKETEVHVAGQGANKYLRTDRDNTSRNNLDELPDC